MTSQTTHQPNFPPRQRGAVLDALYRHSVVLLVLVTVGFVGYRMVRPALRAEAVIDHELAVRAALETIHRHQLAAFSEPGETPARCLALSDVAERARTADGLPDGFDLIDERGVELLRGHGYYVAVYRADPDEPGGRAWSRTTGSPAAGTTGYGAFAWPIEYTPRSQWCFFIDHRGKMLGSWNFDGRMEGLRDPFPPPEQPLAEYMRAEREDEDSTWAVFAELGEVPVPLAGTEPDR